MNRLPVCHYYQSGYCRNGDFCPFAHPTIRCREFSSTGWCPYGYHCHFWHDQSLVNTSISREAKPCHFFAIGQCKYGEKCAFSHDLKWDMGSAITLAEYKASKRSSQLNLTKHVDPQYQQSPEPTPHESFGRFNLDDDNDSPRPACVDPKSAPPHGDTPVPVRGPVLRPEVQNRGGKNKSELCRLQQLEVSHLLRSYPSDRLHEVDSSGNGRMFFLRFSSTDPDWVYDVREIILSIHIVRMYPVDPLKITVLPKDYLPDILVEHLNITIQSWIAYKHKQIRQTNRTEVYLRPFLRWLDRNLDNLFTQGLRKLKSQLAEQPAVSAYQDCFANDSLSPSAPELVGSMGNTSSNKSSVDNSDEDPPTSSTQIEQDQADTESSRFSTKSPISTIAEEIRGERIEPVCPGLVQSSSDNGHDKALLSQLPKPDDVETIPERKASQHLFLNELRLYGKTGTVLHRRLTIIAHCTRCRLPFNWIFTLRYNPSHGTESTGSTEQLRSLPPHSTSCARCRQIMYLSFQALLIHAFTNACGSFYLDGCVADDVPPKLSEFLISCIECNKIVKLTGVEPGRRTNKHCTVCHSLVGIEFSNFRLEMVTGFDQYISNRSHTRSETSGAGRLPRSVRRLINQTQNQLIRDGSPLPDLGTCRHYRKSHRWLRFPCCGRAEPCDVCHDESAVDGHEMQLATSMICGYCAKEQPFSSSKPCVRCGKHLSGSRSAHWEGGKGCRNKVTMSRKDSKKYSQMNKTISRSKTKS